MIFLRQRIPDGRFVFYDFVKKKQLLNELNDKLFKYFNI